MAANKTYSVPRRLSLLSFMALTTLFAMFFALLRALQAPAAVYLFFGLQGAATCLAQMLGKAVPRSASVVTGAVFTFVLLVIGAVYEKTQYGHVGMTLCVLPWALLAGAILGYVTGTVVASVFMLVDMFESRFSPHEQGEPFKE